MTNFPAPPPQILIHIHIYSNKNKQVNVFLLIFYIQMHVPQVFSLGYGTYKKKEIERENEGVGERALYKSITRAMQSALHYVKNVIFWLH